MRRAIGIWAVGTALFLAAGDGPAAAMTCADPFQRIGRTFLADGPEMDAGVGMGRTRRDVAGSPAPSERNRNRSRDSGPDGVRPDDATGEQVR